MHIKTAPAKPSTNGLVERFNATFKSAMRAMDGETDDFGLKLSNFLLSYRQAVHSTTNETPSKLFFSRKIRTRLDLLKPDTKQCVQDKQMKLSLAGKQTFMELVLGQSVLARDYRPSVKEKWVTGTVVSRDGPLMYKVLVGNAKWKRHIDQLRPNETEQSQAQTEIPELTGSMPLTRGQGYFNTLPDSQHSEQLAPDVSNNNEPPQVEESRYPQRDRHPPERLAYT
ncbi:uncharacterized protein K02A2.6-like [Mya arenaria]|uniref:uncharacterized protein K02A2.6-like n=1 Tax=Mya arenaria TaxID=6604 RepID=UPI0022E42335|nr:uncharacterized protein K02A2.6-like [Mya arenaria]